MIMNRAGNYQNVEYAERIRMKFKLFKQSINKMLINLETRLEDIISKLDPNPTLQEMFELVQKEGDLNLSEIVNYHNKYFEYKDKQHIFIYDDFPVNLVEAKLEKIKKSIQENIVFNIDQFFIYKAGNLFSDELRFESFLLSETKDSVEQSRTCDHYAFAVLNRPINMHSQENLVFYIEKQEGDVGVGLCDLQQMKAHNFRPKLNVVGSGAYILFQDKYTIHTDEAAKNWVTHGFKFVAKDTIQVSYDPDKKTISWNKLNSDEVYVAPYSKFDNQLHFCVVMKQKGSIVKILQ
ncbi:hypothetical protein pb186bvf_003627 [Paramecium bursaria]